MGNLADATQPAHRSRSWRPQPETQTDTTTKGATEIAIAVVMEFEGATVAPSRRWAHSFDAAPAR